MSTSSESLAWIANHYGVPARRGQHIRFAGALARITGASGPHLRARMLETCRWAKAGQMVNLHPTWEVDWQATPTPRTPESADERGAARIDRHHTSCPAIRDGACICAELADERGA